MEKQWHFDYWEEPKAPSPPVSSPEERAQAQRESDEFIEKVFEKVKRFAFAPNPDKERRFLQLVEHMGLFAEMYYARAEAKLEEGRGAVFLSLKNPFYIFGEGDDGHLFFLRLFQVCEDITLEYREGALKISGLADLRDVFPPEEAN